MPKVKLLIDGPYPYSDQVYEKGDVFYVGPQACADGVKGRVFDFVSDDPPPAPPDTRTEEQKLAAAAADKQIVENELEATKAALEAEQAKRHELETLLEQATAGGSSAAAAAGSGS